MPAVAHDDGGELPLGQLTEPRIHVPAQGDDFKIRPLGQYLRLTAEAARADHGPGGQVFSES